MRKIDALLPIFGSIIIIILIAIPLFTQSVENIPNYLAGLAALVTSWISLYFSVIRFAIRRPVLKTECNVGTIQLAPTEGLRTYLRLKVTNTGQTVAKNCVGRLLEIRDPYGKVVQYDPYSFFWARQDDEKVGFSPVQIYAGDSEYLDIARIKHADKFLKLRISTKGQFIPRGGVFQLRDYYVLVGIYADDTIPHKAWYQIKINIESLQDSCLQKVKRPVQNK